MIDIYNDFISDRIKKALVNEASIEDNIIHDVKGPHLDLDEDEGYLLSLRRTIKVMDKNGTTYKITIEEDKD
tara:strand:+ start:2937 stop:3152 length:216 start_codon:yes stop_codon:yes gene_type:complete